MKPIDLESLINRHLDGVASGDEVAELSLELEQTETSRQLYLRLAQLHASLASSEGMVMEKVPATVAPLKPNSSVAKEAWFPWPWRWAAAAGSILVTVIILLVISNRGLRTATLASGKIATLVRTMGTQVSGPAGRLQPGQPLSSGRIVVTAGAAEILFRNGVTLVLEGPAELELLTPMRVFLHSGQAVGRVPKNARGFQMETPGASLVDMGTEFAMKTGPGLITDVQVYEGEVITTPRSANAAGSFSQRLTAGHAARFIPGARAVSQPLTYAANRFVRRLPQDLPIERKDVTPEHFNESRFDEILITAPRQAIVVDGDLSEWGVEGAFRRERSGWPGNDYYIEGRMRYDAEFVYIGAHIGDPMPLLNVINPATDGELSWRGGGLQVRISTERKTGWPVDANAPFYYKHRDLPADAQQLVKATSDNLAHLTFWHYAPDGQNCLHIAYGMDFHGGVVNPPGYRGAFRKDADGRGYTLEYAIPWSLLHAESDPPRADDTLGVSWTVHWSDESGRLWHGQLTELRNASEPLRIYTWERAATWGRAVYR